MKHVPFFTHSGWSELYPIGKNHQKGKLLIGAFELSELWAWAAYEYITEKEQREQEKVHFALQNGSLNDRWVPTKASTGLIAALEPGQNLKWNGLTLFRWTTETEAPREAKSEEICYLQSPMDLFRKSKEWILNQSSTIIHAWGLNNPNQVALENHALIIGDQQSIWVHPTSKLIACTLNSTDGPIFIGPDVEIQEGSHLRGPLVIGEKTVVKMSTRIYGSSAIGPQCRVGGEISNCTFLGYSNKGHDGFLGQSVIGHWCNLGADTNSSNLKSNYGPIRIWSETDQEFVDSTLQFCGLLMGDHSKCGINTMFTTGTVVGTGCNIYGSGFQPKHIPDFAWGGGNEWQLHDFNRFLETAQRVMERRGKSLEATETASLKEQHSSAHLRFDARDA